jgi:hypothetical protein
MRQMSTNNKLKKYYSSYDKEKQNQIEEYIENGGNILNVFGNIEEKSYFDIYTQLWYEPKDCENIEREIRSFNVSSLLLKPEKIHGLQKVWINASFEYEPKVVSYLYILANFRFNIVKSIRKYENISDNGLWYVKDYEKYKEHIDDIYNNTKDDSIKAQIQFCRYINEGR